MNTINLSAGLKWLSLLALAAAFVVYATTDFSLGGSSPLGLLLVAAGGWILQLKERLVGYLLLFFAGGSLLVFPFLYDAPFAYAPLTLPIALFALKGLLQWWKDDR